MEGPWRLCTSTCHQCDPGTRLCDSAMGTRYSLLQHNNPGCWWTAAFVSNLPPTWDAWVIQYNSTPSSTCWPSRGPSSGLIHEDSDTDPLLKGYARRAVFLRVAWGFCQAFHFSLPGPSEIRSCFCKQAGLRRVCALWYGEEFLPSCEAICTLSSHTISISQDLAEHSPAPAVIPATTVAATFPFTKNDTPPKPPTPIRHDHASTPDDKFSLEPRWLCMKGMWVQVFRQAVGIRDLGCFLLTSWHGFCRERITWHCQWVINCFCDGMEKLELRCFLQLVKKTSQSHEVQLICSIFKEPGWNKKTCYLETIQQSLYGRMIMVIFLDVINENV